MAAVDILIGEAYDVYTNSAKFEVTINTNVSYDGEFIILGSEYLGPGSFRVGNWDFIWTGLNPNYDTKEGLQLIKWNAFIGPSSLTGILKIKDITETGFDSGDLNVILQGGVPSNPQFEGISPNFTRGSVPEPSEDPTWTDTGNFRCVQENGVNTGYQEKEQQDTNSISPTFNELRWINNGLNIQACPLPVLENTGFKAWTTLEEYYIDSGQATGNEKPNNPGDPDYIAPIYDPTTCPLP